MSHLKHLRHQGGVIAALGRTALQIARQKRSGASEGGAQAPGPWIEQTVAPRPAALVRDYVRHVGGDPKAYRDHLPPHLYPQWGFPLMSRTLEGVAYPMERVLNGGCSFEVNAPLPVDQPLRLRARLEEIDDDGRRAILFQKLITGTDAHPEALVATVQAIVPLKREKGVKKTPPRVPEQAREITRWSLKPQDGSDFAALTGDINPIHWLGPYARAMGFKSTILHGYSILAHALEGLNQHLWLGDVHRLSRVEVRFVKPLVLPARVGLYVVPTEAGMEVFVGDAPGGPAYMRGSVEATSP